MRCELCRFWDDPKTFAVDDLSGVERTVSIGICRRRAPAAVSIGANAVWPETWSDAWCGEFSDKNGVTVTPGFAYGGLVSSPGAVLRKPPPSKDD